jgi:hypothetical protein
MNTKRLNNNQAEDQAEHRLEKVERETHYIYNEADGEWFADSSIPRDIHKLEQRHWIEVKTQYYKDGSVMAKMFKAPRNCLSPRDYNPDKPKRDRKPLSEEQKAKMQAGRKNKNSELKDET